MNRDKKPIEELIKELAKSQQQTSELQQEIAFTMKMINTSPTFILTINPDGKTLLMNETMLNNLGYTTAEVVGRDYLNTFIAEKDRATAAKVFETLVQKKVSKVNEIYMLTKTGEELLVEWHCTPVLKEDGAIDYIFGIGIDISKRKQVEKTVRNGEEKYRTLIEQSLQGILIVQDFHIVFANKSMAEITGYTIDELLSLPPEKVRAMIHQDDQALVWGRFKERLEGKEVPPRYEYRGIRKDGSTRWLEVHANRIEYKGKPAIQGILLDITQRKQTENALHESEEKFRMLAEQSPNMIFINKGGKVVYANKRCEEMMGYTRKEFYSPDFDFHNLIAPESRGIIESAFAAHMSGKEVEPYEYTLLTKEGNSIEAIITSKLIDYGEDKAILGIITDITERKKVEEELKSAEKKFRELFDSAGDAIFIHDFDGQFLEVNKTACERLNYTKDELLQMTPMDIETQEFAESLPDRIKEVIEKGSVFFETVHLSKDGRAIPIELSARPVDFQGKPAILSVARDISDRKTTAEKLKQSLQKLETTIENTLQAMAKILETRDPYTAGHQQKVAALALAIAQEMKLPADQAKALNVAALVHDIGKIYVPAEILSRPTKLSESEFALIKTHPTVSHDILKTIEFPWPIAKIVLQHHERLNGSGYPQQLKGEEIVFEARILAIADVVEAMSSHRPYRPARTLQETLEEIIKNKGILYDPEIADVCIKLLKEKRFGFEAYK